MYGSILGNLLGTLYFLAFQCAGVLLAHKLLREEPPVTKIFLGSTIGSLLLQWLPVLAAFFLDFTGTAHLIALILLIFICIAGTRIRGGNRTISGSNSFAYAVRRHLGIVLLFLVTSILWIILLLTHTLAPAADGSLHCGQCTYGDMNMHLGFITSIAVQKTFPPEYSIYPGTKLSYPFLSDSISSSIYLLGASLRYAYILPMITAFWQIIGTVYLFAYEVFRSRAKALLTWVLYLFNGGLGFVYFFDWANNREYRFSDIFTGFYTTPTNLVNHNIRWVNLIADMLLPQRATLFGYAVAIPCIYLLYKAIWGNHPCGQTDTLSGNHPCEQPSDNISPGQTSSPSGMILSEQTVSPSGMIPSEQTVSLSGMIPSGQTGSPSGMIPSGQTSSPSGANSLLQPHNASYFLVAGLLLGGLPMIHTHSFLAVGLVSASWLLYVLYLENSNRTKSVPNNTLFARSLSHLSGSAFLVLFFLLMYGVSFSLKRGVLQGTALMPLAVVIFAGMVCCGLWLLFAHIRRNGYKTFLSTWGLFLLCALLPALPQLFFWTFGQVSEGGFVRGHFNWGNLGDDYLWFYLKNIGIPCFFILGAIFSGRKKTSRLLLPAGLIWLLAELVVFTPNTYDNNKLLYIAYLLLLLAAADYAVELYHAFSVFQTNGAKIFACLTLTACLLSGILTLGREVVSDYQNYSLSHVKLAEYVEANTAPDAVFLTNTRHVNEIASLTGRSIVCGADTFLYFHGIDTNERKEELRQMYEAPADSLALYKKYQVNYITVSAYERNSYQVDEMWFVNHCALLFEDGDVRLYAVNPVTD